MLTFLVTVRPYSNVDSRCDTHLTNTLHPPWWVSPAIRRPAGAAGLRVGWGHAAPWSLLVSGKRICCKSRPQTYAWTDYWNE